MAELLPQASEAHQLVVSTQSVEVVDRLNPEDLIVVDRKDGGWVFERLDKDRLEEGLQDYSLGERWQMNVIGGRPAR